MTNEQIIQCAIEEGFVSAAIVDTSEIVFDPVFRPYCAENLCGQYGANYSCPPDCGSPEEMKQKILRYLPLRRQNVCKQLTGKSKMQFPQSFARMALILRVAVFRLFVYP